MFTIEQYTNRAYRPVTRVHSSGRVATRLHKMTTVGKVRVKNPRGRVVLTGRIVQQGEHFVFKAE